MSGSSVRTSGPWPALRAVVNARLEEISFRVGVVSVLAALAGLTLIVGAVLVTAMPGTTSPLAGAWNMANAKVVPTAPSAAPIVAPTAPRSPAAASAAASASSSRPASSSRLAGAHAAAAARPRAGFGAAAPGAAGGGERHRSGGGFAGRDPGWGGFGGFGGFGAGSARHGGGTGGFRLRR